MIYLLGVNHQVQHERNAQLSMVFDFYLSKKVEELNITFIAEEWSEDSSRISSVKTTVPQDIAKRYKIKHMYCDPRKDERKEIGWLSKSDDYLREKFWLNKIKPYLNHNMIFVCGSDHLESFGKLLSKCGYNFQVLPKRFDISPYLQSQNKDL